MQSWQATLDKMLRQKEQEVKAQFQAEEDAVKKEIQEINAKLDDSKIHDKRQLEASTTFNTLKGVLTSKSGFIFHRLKIF